MRTSEVVALLDLLAGRGTVAWQVSGGTDGGARLVVDTSGVDGAMRLLVSRGFTATRTELPSHVELAHPRYGRVVLLPCSFRADRSAVWHGAAGPVELAAHRFDPVDTVPRRVAWEVVVPGLDPVGLDPVRPEDGGTVIPEDEGGPAPAV